MAFATQNNVIHWGIWNDRPPVFITKGRLKGKGMADNFYASISDYLPNRKHLFIEAKLQRITAMMSAGEKVCSIMIKTNAREKRIHFTDTPINLVPASKAIFRKEKFSNNVDKIVWIEHKIDLVSTMKLENGLRLGLVSGISHGPILDFQIEQISSSPQIYKHTGFKSPRSIVLMLAADRVDFTLQQTWAASYTFDGSMEGFLSFDIFDINDYDEIHIGCAKNEWGKKAISELNCVTDRIKDDFFEDIIRWIPETERSSYKRHYNEYYDNLRNNKSEINCPSGKSNL